MIAECWCLRDRQEEDEGGQRCRSRSREAAAVSRSRRRRRRRQSRGGGRAKRHTVRYKRKRIMRKVGRAGRKCYYYQWVNSDQRTNHASTDRSSVRPHLRSNDDDDNNTPASFAVEIKRYWLLSRRIRRSCVSRNQTKIMSIQPSE